ncbi:MAG: MFS transporter [Pseudomonadota bacterium]|nr:MFS transporter [Pseudomonadota bacterium]
MSREMNPPQPEAAETESRWGAFASRAFAVIWAASTLSNVGLAMFDTATGWYMANMSRDPMVVALIQTATSLPLFLFTIPAGTLTDLVDARRLLIGVNVVIFAIAATFATAVSLGFTTPKLLLGATFLLGVGGALAAPAWVSIAPLLVPSRDLDAAVAANSTGYNISRALGPALGGLVIARVGVLGPFWIYALSNVLVIAALIWWRPPRRITSSLPAERFMTAIRTGVRHAQHNHHLHATLMRTLAFFPFASAYWALLPLIARAQPAQGAAFYGLLLAAIGLGAIVGSALLSRLKDWLGPDALVAWASVGTAVALVMFALSRDPVSALAAGVIAGAMWTLIISTLYVSAQLSLPNWVRGRGLAIFLTVIFGASTFASVLWGHIAALRGVDLALYIAAAGALLAIPMSWGSRLQTGIGADLAPSLHWRSPRVIFDVGWSQGPALVTIRYRIDPRDRDEFLSAMGEIGHERRRDGAYAWGVFEELATEGRYTETFLIESWLELMHLYERVTNADRRMEERVRKLLVETPVVTHLIAPRRGRRNLRLAT